MKFALVFDGHLPPSGNKSDPASAWDIRNQLSPQLEELWSEHPVLHRLRPGATRPEHGPGRGSLCAPIQVANHPYLPLVRKSLHMVCSIKILFLRRDEPGQLITQNGDIGSRIKTLFDALRMPKDDELRKGTPSFSPLYCLMESDSLVTGFAVRTERYLAATANNPKAARLTVEVNTSITRLDANNAVLLAD